MPPKIGELIISVERAGFVNGGGKGCHRKATDRHIVVRQSDAA
jgi:hypothetical protein